MAVFPAGFTSRYLFLSLSTLLICTSGVGVVGILGPPSFNLEWHVDVLDFSPLCFVFSSRAPIEDTPFEFFLFTIPGRKPELQEAEDEVFFLSTGLLGGRERTGDFDFLEQLISAIFSLSERVGKFDRATCSRAS